MDDPELLGHGEFEAVSSADGFDKDALVQFDEYESKGYLRSFSSYGELVGFLDGESPVLSEVMILTKLRGGKVKRRVLLNCKKAGLSRSS